MDIPTLIGKNRGAVVLIDVRIPQAEGKLNISIKGTGFIVSPDGKFITNTHVYKTIAEAEMAHMGVSVPGIPAENGLTIYDRFPIKMVRIDEENDTCLMEIISDKKDFAFIELPKEPKPVKEGEEIIHSGYPLAVEMLNMGFGITMTTNRALVSSIKRRGIDGSFHFFLIDNHINNGSSGSPVFSTETGEVIGIASAKISARIPINEKIIADIPANMGICRPIQYAIDLISK